MDNNHQMVNNEILANKYGRKYMSRLSIRLPQMSKKEAQVHQLAYDVSDIGDKLSSCRRNIPSVITNRQDIYAEFQHIFNSIETLNRTLHDNGDYIGHSVRDYISAERRIEETLGTLSNKTPMYIEGRQYYDGRNVDDSRDKGLFNWFGSKFSSSVKHIGNFFGDIGQVINNTYHQAERYLCDAVDFLSSRLETRIAFSTQLYLNAIDAWPTWNELGQWASNEWNKTVDYLGDSLEQVVKGNFSDKVTLLGTTGQIGLGLLGIDLPMDIRDVVADFTRWEWSWGHAGQTALDLVGLIPVIGAVKYGDEVGTLVKGAIKSFDDIIDGFKGTIRTFSDFFNVKSFELASLGPYVDSHTVNNMIETATDNMNHIDEVHDGMKHVDESFDGLTKVDEVESVVEGAGNLVYKADFADHIINAQGIVRKGSKGIVGGHNLDSFTKILTDQGWNIDDLILSKTPHPTIPGLFEIKYQIPALDAAQNVIEGQFKNIPYPKTVFDPSVISNDDILKWGKEAMEQAFSGGEVAGRVVDGIASNGLKFRGYIDEATGKITNFFPVFQ